MSKSGTPLDWMLTVYLETVRAAEFNDDPAVLKQALFRIAWRIEEEHDRRSSKPLKTALGIVPKTS